LFCLAAGRMDPLEINGKRSLGISNPQHGGVGLAFNIKMLQAYMILQAIYLVYLLFAPHKWWKRILHLLVATVVMLVISLAWIAVVDLTPSSQRPYVGSSNDNTEIELLVGHNGLERLGSAAYCKMRIADWTMVIPQIKMRP